MRDMNISVTCAHCGEELDTNEASRDEIVEGMLDAELEFHIGEHSCFSAGPSEAPAKLRIVNTDKKR